MHEPQPGGVTTAPSARNKSGNPGALPRTARLRSKVSRSSVHRQLAATRRTSAAAAGQPATYDAEAITMLCTERHRQRQGSLSLVRGLRRSGTSVRLTTISCVGRPIIGATSKPETSWPRRSLRNAYLRCRLDNARHEATLSAHLVSTSSSTVQSSDRAYQAASRTCLWAFSPFFVTEVRVTNRMNQVFGVTRPSAFPSTITRLHLGTVTGMRPCAVRTPSQWIRPDEGIENPCSWRMAVGKDDD